MESFKKIINQFFNIDYWTGFERDIDLWLGTVDSFYFDDLLIPFKLEINKELLSINKVDRVYFIKGLLNNCPVYLENENFIEDRETIRIYIKEGDKPVVYDTRKDYIITTYKLWTDVLNIIRLTCKTFDIEYQDKIDILGHNSITFSTTISEPENKHPDIFINGKAFSLFMAWHEKHRLHGNLSDYNFIIKKMVSEKLIFELRNKTYLDFLAEYNFSLSKLKPLEGCETEGRKNIYLSLKSAL